MGRPRVVKKISHEIDLKQGTIGENNVSDYSSTFIKHRNFNRVKSLKPKPAKPQPQYPPMEVQTTTMKAFGTPDLTVKRDMIRPDENSMEYGLPFNSDTEYKHHYQKKSPLPVIQKRPKTYADFDHGPLAKFDGKTVNKMFYKEWKYPAPRRFGELPSFTQSLIFPDKSEEELKNLLYSRTQLDFPYKTSAKPTMVKAYEPNIKVGEGEHCHETTHRSNFKYVPGALEKTLDLPEKKTPKLSRPPKMDATTKYQSDFPRKANYPLPPKPVTPAPATLEIKMNNRHVFETEQRNQFHGWDVNKHKRPDPAKLSDNTERSDKPMASETTTTHDFTKKEVEPSRPAAASRPLTNVRIDKAKFRDLTMNRVFFQDWGARRRLRYGDFHEACKEIRNLPKVISVGPVESTTKSTFVKKTGRPRTSMKPENQTIDTSQEHDFNTVTRMAYKYPPNSAYEIEDFEVKC